MAHALLCRVETRLDASPVVLTSYPENMLAKLTDSESVPFQTRTADLGECLYPNPDNVWEVLDEAEHAEYGSVKPVSES